MNRSIFLSLLFIGLLIACTKAKIEDTLLTDDFVRWKKNQNISLDMFEGSGPSNAFSAYVAIYFIYDVDSKGDLNFNVTTFLDKKKSYASKLTEDTDPNRYKLFPTLYKLKLDHFEIYARKLRKFLIEHKTSFDPDSIESIPERFYLEADEEWGKIMDDIENRDDYTEEHFRYLRNRIDIDLEEYKDFDDSVNNFNPSNLPD